MIAPLRFLHPRRIFHRQILNSLKGKYAGRRCFIMGNGPSLNAMNLELLRNEVVWGLNKCNLLFERISWRPALHVGVDRVVIPDMRDDLLQMCRDLPETRFFLPLYFVETGLIPVRENMVLFRDTEPAPEKGPAGVFSNDAAEYVYKSKTVAIVALQLAAFLGFNPIYLIGCDTNYTVPQSVEREGEMTLRSTQDDDPNHFAPNYFGKSALWRDPNPEAMLRNYEMVAQIAQERGLQIFNATVGGKLEAFPRVDYSTLFSG